MQILKINEGPNHFDEETKEYGINALAFLSNGLVLSVGDDRTARLWDP